MLWEMTGSLDAHPLWLSNLTISQRTPKEPAQIRVEWGALKTMFALKNERMLELFSFYGTLYYILSK